MDIPTSLLEQRIDRGAILHSTMFENIDHGKFFVVIGISSEFVGTMKEQHIKELLEKARTSELFSKVQIREFLY